MKFNLRDVFLNNRAEQLPLDVWDEFIVPVHFEKINIQGDRKSVLIQGGRGCGKTMFIRYFCHPTVFSEDRGRVPEKSLENIGLYWKPDTRFCGMLSDPWLEAPLAKSSFLYYATLNILEDFYEALLSIEKCDLEGGRLSLLKTPIPKDMSPYFDESVKNFSDLGKFIREQKAFFEVWIENPASPKPKFLVFGSILERLTNVLAEANPRLADMFVRIFVDEFENLTESQQRLLNDFIKNPSERFCINIASRRHAKISKDTSGLEKIVLVHDYRIVDLEKEFLDQSTKENFHLLAAEALLHRLNALGMEVKPEGYDLSILKDPSRLAERASNQYQSAIKNAARRILPQHTVSEIAQMAIKDSALRGRIEKLIEEGLKFKPAHRKYKVQDFIDENHPEISVVVGCLLNREKPDPAVLLEELKKAKANDPESKFLGGGGWVDNNLYGVLFYLYQGLPRRPCLLYAGFDRFCQLARSNLRFFQELCHEAFTIHQSDTQANITCIDDLVVLPGTQAEAARIASEALLAEVERLGSYGLELMTIVRRLGKLFQLAHKRPSQSEPEVNHFSISVTATDPLSLKSKELLEQAKVWSVLYEQPDTKNKNEGDLPDMDYMPNPIFSPYFGISYRKIRKLTLQAADFNTITDVETDRFQTLVKKFEKKWIGELDAAQGELL